MTSVVVPVFNGGSVLDRTVPALLALHGVDEWVWVDDGSTDDTAARLEAALSGTAAARVVRLGENWGRSAARNTGVAATRGDVLAFFDADVEPDPEAVARLAEALSAPGALASVARVRSILDRPADPYQRYLAHHARGARPTSGPLAWRYFLSGACALRRETLEQMGGFAEGVAYGEDFELACRLSREAPHGLRVADTRVAVHDVGTLGTALANAEACGRALAWIAARFPEAVQIAEIPRMATRLPVGPFVPPRGALCRLVRGLPASVQPASVRVALGLSLLRGFRRG